MTIVSLDRCSYSLDKEEVMAMAVAARTMMQTTLTIRTLCPRRQALPLCLIQHPVVAMLLHSQVASYAIRFVMCPLSQCTRLILDSGNVCSRDEKWFSGQLYVTYSSSPRSPLSHQTDVLSSTGSQTPGWMAVYVPSHVNFFK